LRLKSLLLRAILEVELVISKEVWNSLESL
jgi:hypothetical protein